MSAIINASLRSIRAFAKQNNLRAVESEPIGNETERFSILTSMWYQYIVLHNFHVSRVSSDESTNADAKINEVVILKQLDDQDTPLLQVLLRLTFNDVTQKSHIDSEIPPEEYSQTDAKLVQYITTSLLNMFPQSFSN